jgi:hypothetical protein
VLVTAPPGRLRAPQDNGGVLAEPPLEAAGRHIAANREYLDRANLQILGRDWNDLRRAARKAAVDSARTYLSAAGEPLPLFDSDSLVMAGHQPELFHPGVWIKNFALHGLSTRFATTPVNLIVDNDTAKSTVLRLPDLGSVAARFQHAEPRHVENVPPQANAHIASVPFDRWAGEVPYEERIVHDEELFGSLPERAEEIYRNWSFQPFLGSFWGETRRQAARSPLLGERLAAGRRYFERLWDSHNLEVPVSSLCQTEPFAWFSCHLLTELPRFHSIYNECVHAYRRRQRIRSRNHPVPDLAVEQDWLEVPFWAWKSGQNRRGRLMVRQSGSGIELRVKQPQGNETWPSLPLHSEAAAIRAWLELEKSGLKVRSRALTNTLFARLFLADLFIHGIGGAKYDELTDDIIRRFYGLEPPAYLVLSATLHLPLPSRPPGRETCRHLARELRDLYYNPQRHLDGAYLSPEVRQLVSQKEAWIARQAERSEAKRERFLALRQVNDRLRDSVTKTDGKLARELDSCERDLQANAVIQRRDYAFCLYPETQVRQFCSRFLEVRG